MPYKEKVRRRDEQSGEGTKYQCEAGTHEKKFVK